MESKRPVSLTRLELYRQVWKTPMVKLAAQYGISDNGLAKICRRLGVPYPDRGYWRKKETGKEVYVKKLQKNNGEFPTQVTITPTNPAANPDIRTAEKAARLQAVRELSSQLSASIPAKTTSLHHLLIRELNRPDKNGLHREPTPIEKRQFRVLQALFTILEPYGGTVGWGHVRRNSSPRPSEYEYRDGTYLQLQKENIKYDFGEIHQHFETPIPAEERSRYPMSQKYCHEYHPTGLMFFNLTTTVPDGFPRYWKESSEKSMEVILPEIAATCLAIRPYLENERIEQEREKRRQWIIEERTRRRNRRHHLHKAQWECFKKSADEWGEIAQIRQYLKALRSEPINPEIRVGKKDIGEWLEWAEEHLQREEKRYSCNSTFSRIASLVIRD